MTLQAKAAAMTLRTLADKIDATQERRGLRYIIAMEPGTGRPLIEAAAGLRAIADALEREMAQYDEDHHNGDFPNTCTPWEIGDLGFTVRDEPVVITALGVSPDGEARIAQYTYLTEPSAVSAGDVDDLLPETHAEFEARVASGEWKYGDRRAPRKAGSTDLRSIPGVKVPAWAQGVAR